MPFDDLRGVLQKLDEIGWLKKVDGADWDLEIGAINELMAERQGPALLFDNIKGYPLGYRIATNLLHTAKGQRVAFELPDELSEVEIIKDWKDKWNRYQPVPPVVVESGPILENVLTGDDIDLLKFPVPKWHELDAGRYIGTCSVNISKDPEEGWVNLGNYRAQVHDRKTVGFMTTPGKHANLIRHKYWARGEKCPVAVCFGLDPFLFGLATMPIPWGISEIEMAGYLKGRPVEVIKGPVTGLPIPATAEIVIEGFSSDPSVEARSEGPFGEWTGYYAAGVRPEPVIEVAALYHRNNPILLGQPPIKPPVNTWFPIPLHTATFLWNRLDACRVPGIKGVYVHGPGNRIIAVISIKQMFLGHAKQVGTLAAGLLQGGGATGKWIIVVEDDIDPANMGDVLWAVTTRCDPEVQIDIVRGFLDSPGNPRLTPEKRRSGDYTSAKVIIDACRPYHWIDQFEPVARVSDELRLKVFEKWGSLFS